MDPKQPKKRRKQRKKHNADKVGPDFDWTTLLRGDLIKIAQGSGPYYTGQNDQGQETKDCLGEPGWYSVASLDSSGIHAYNEWGHSYLRMKDDPSKKSGIIRAAHKIQRVKRKDEPNNNTDSSSNNE